MGLSLLYVGPTGVEIWSSGLIGGSNEVANQIWDAYDAVRES